MNETSPGATDSSASSPGPHPAAPPSFLDWLPWEKILIWGLFFLTVYVLRDFFFIIFMTFLLTYTMRTCVRSVGRFVLGGRESAWVDRLLSVAGFALLLLGLYGAGRYLGPKLFSQGKTLVQQATLLDPQRDLNRIIEKTAGPYLFRRKYNGRESARYKEAFEAFRKQDPGRAAYADFPALREGLESGFEAQEVLQLKGQAGRLPESDFRAWFLREKAPRLFEQDREARIAEWEKRYTDSLVLFPDKPRLEELKKMEDFEAQRTAGVFQIILAEAAGRPESREKYRAEWEAYMVETGLASIRGSPAYDGRFRAFFDRVRAGKEPGLARLLLPYDFETYGALTKAYEKGEEAFAAAAADAFPRDEEALRRAFEQEKTREEVAAFIATPFYDRLRENLSRYLEAGIQNTVAWTQKAVADLVTIPVQLSLCLLISFFISLDMPRISRGVLGLRQSRMRDFFEEIAPGLYNFGRLIGRAFQAQGFIAVLNAGLTFVAIRLLGITNEAFLCAVVFVCSFIPVLGVVISSIPIAAMAIVQPDGSMFLALEAVAAVLVIHFIETSFLNPKILGNMLHLHPVLVLAVLAIGEHFFGVWGLLLAVPVTVYVIRCVILNEEIPGLIEHDPFGRGGARPRPQESGREAGIPPGGASGGEKPARADARTEAAGGSLDRSAPPGTTRPAN